MKGLFRRQYVSKTAVDDVSFRIEPGEFVGFLGPNGAGKTTTLKILSGVLHPTSGEVSVLGFKPWKREAAFQKRFSLVLGQKNQLWMDLPAFDSFELNREIYDVSSADFKAKLAELGELLDIAKLWHTPVRKLSLGERMKCELAASLLHSPEVLFLDEPTIGLDVVSQVRVREFLREYNQRTGLTVLLTSHYSGDIESLCKRVIVISEGKKMFDGALKNLTDAVGNKRSIRLRLSRLPSENELAHITDAESELQIDGYQLTIAVPREQVAVRVSQLLTTLPVTDLSVEEVAVENVIRDLFTQHKAEHEKSESNGPVEGAAPLETTT
jgi:ABC-2 type transport system ATP-binding protein